MVGDAQMPRFPRLLGDVSVLKKEVVGNPMYAPWLIRRFGEDLMVFRINFRCLFDALGGVTTESL